MTLTLLNIHQKAFFPLKILNPPSLPRYLVRMEADCGTGAPLHHQQLCDLHIECAQEAAGLFHQVIRVNSKYKAKSQRDKKTLSAPRRPSGEAHKNVCFYADDYH